LRRSKTRLTALAGTGYLVLALASIAVFCIQKGIGSWEAFVTAYGALEAGDMTRYLLPGAVVVNLLLAFVSWRLPVLSTRFQYGAVLLAGSLAGFCMVISVFMFRNWYQGRVPEDQVLLQVVTPLAITLGYVVLAYSLAKILIIASTSSYGERG
jgi:hypothetical protein